MTRPAILLLAILAAFVQLHGRTISGAVVSDLDSAAVAGATCRLIADDKLLAGTTTDASGNFTLSTDDKTRLSLQISMSGFNSTEIIIETGSKNINLGTVYLTEGIALNDVTVTANTLTDSKGRTIIYPSGTDVKASSTAVSLFQKLPLAGLEANPINRTISVDGGTPMILINGVPSTIDDVNALQPKDIDKIEYSRITPARYADKGCTGFLNITLRKRTDGGTIYMWGRSAVNTAFVDGNVRGSYHQGPSQFTLSYNPSWRNYQSVYDNVKESYIGNDFRVNLEKHDRNPFYYHYHNINLKYDYSPNASTLFSATFRATPTYSKHRLIGNTIDSELGNYENLNETKDDSFSPSLDLFLRKDFNEKNSLEVQVVGTLGSDKYSRLNGFRYEAGNSEVYIIDADSRRRSLITEISYVHKFSDKTSLSAGVQNTISRSKNKYYDFELHYPAIQDKPFISSSTEFKNIISLYESRLTENNNYAYARLGQQAGKVYLSLSTGAKLFWINNGGNHRRFVRNLSQAQANWNISNKWTLAAAFSYSPGIPSLSSLTNYPQKTTPYLISNGNPNLKVTEFFTFQLMPSFQYKKFNASLLMGHRIVGNCEMNELTYLGDHMFLSQTINARKSWRTSANLNMRISDIAGFGANVNIGLLHDETMSDTWTHALTSFSGSFSLWWSKGPYTVSYWRKIPGKYLSGHTVWKEENGDALAFEYRLNKHFNFGINWMYMYDKKGTRYPSWTYSPVNPGTRERYIKDNGNMVVLTASYSANFGSIFRTGRRSLNNSDNDSSLLKM